jgi:hypothetical protein
MLGPTKLIGVSLHTVTEAEAVGSLPAVSEIGKWAGPIKARRGASQHGARGSPLTGADRALARRSMHGTLRHRSGA